MAQWYEWFLKRTSLPPELSPSLPRLTLSGKSQLRVENHRELLSLSPERVEIGCGRLRILIEGKDLLLRAMNPDELLLSGEIRCVSMVGE